MWHFGAHNVITTPILTSTNYCLRFEFCVAFCSQKKKDIQQNPFVFEKNPPESTGIFGPVLDPGDRSGGQAYLKSVIGTAMPCVLVVDISNIDCAVLISKNKSNLFEQTKCVETGHCTINVFSLDVFF